MLNFPKDQLPALSHGKRRAPEPQAGGNATDIDSRPAKRPHLESPGRNQPGEPRITSTKPLVRVPGPPPHALWAIAPPVVQPSPPGALPVWREPSHDAAHTLPTAPHIRVATTTLLSQVPPANSALSGIASQAYRGRLATQAFKPPGSMVTFTNRTTSTTTTTTTTSTTAAPSSAVNGRTRQQPAVLDKLQSAGPVAKIEVEEYVNDERFEWLARRVRDAQPVAIKHAISTIREADFFSLPDVADWLRLCAVLCLHYDAQQDKEPLWQCLEQVVLYFRNIKRQSVDLHNALKTTLLATDTPAGFIRILQRARASKWREDRFNKLFPNTRITDTMTQAITQMAAGLHPEKTAQQAASDFLLARYAVRAAHTAHKAHKARAAYAAHPAPAVAPNPPEEINRFETVNPELLFMPFFGEDITDSGPLPEFWWLADGDNLAAHAFEPGSESTSTATTTATTTPTPAVTYTAPQLPAAPDAQRHDECVADGDNEQSVTGSLLNG